MTGERYHFLHRYGEAIQAYRQAFTMAPDFLQARLSMAWSYILWKGETDTLRAVLRDMPPDGETGFGGGTLLNQRLALLWMDRKPDSLLVLLRANAGSMDPSARVSFAGEAHLLRGDTAAARIAFDSALVIVDAKLRATPDAEHLHGDRATMLARLGRRDDALREIRWIQQSYAKMNSRVADGWSPLARLLVLAGETEAALVEIERQLARPSGLTVPYMRVDPAFDGIRRDPRYQRLLVKYADPPRF